MSYEYEAADEIVKIGLKSMETGIRIFESSTERLVRIVWLITMDKRKESKQTRDRLTSLIKQRKRLKAFAIYDSDLDRFSFQARLHGVNFFILKDESYNDAVTDIVVEESDAKKVNSIYSKLNLTVPERIRKQGPSPELDSKKEATEEEKKKLDQHITQVGRPLPKTLLKAKKKDEDEPDRTSLETKLKDNELQAYQMRRYNLPTSREGAKIDGEKHAIE